MLLPPSPATSHSPLDTTCRTPIYVEHQPMTPPHSQPSELLKGTLDMLILKVVSVGGPIHGYAISQRIRQISREFFQVTQGSLYPALHRLEERGLLDAEWRDTLTGREAKFYKLTRPGRKQLEVEMSDWEKMSDAVALILRTAH
jgi:PadR family transcriptional regulator PadR